MMARANSEPRFRAPCGGRAAVPRGGGTAAPLPLWHLSISPLGPTGVDALPLLTDRIPWREGREPCRQDRSAGRDSLRCDAKLRSGEQSKGANGAPV